MRKRTLAQRRLAQRKRRGRAGFTLMEVLLVLAILVIIGSIVVVNFGGAFTKSKINAAKAQINSFKTPLEMYAMDNAALPNTQQGLQALRQPPADLTDPSSWGPKPYIGEDIPKDPWGNDYIYEHMGGDKFKITSPGPDGQAGSTDDIFEEFG